MFWLLILQLILSHYFHFFCFGFSQLTFIWDLWHRSLTSQSMWCENFRDVWKGLTLGQRPDCKASSLVRGRPDQDSLKSVRKDGLEPSLCQKNLLPGLLWSSQCIGQRRLRNHPTVVSLMPEWSHHLSKAPSRGCSLSAWCYGEGVGGRDCTQRQQT